jgi:hypothetical protein
MNKPDVGARGRKSRIWFGIRNPAPLMFLIVLLLIACNTVNFAVQLGPSRPTESHSLKLPQIQKPAGGNTPTLRAAPTSAPLKAATATSPTPSPTLPPVVQNTTPVVQNTTPVVQNTAPVLQNTTPAPAPTSTLAPAPSATEAVGIPVVTATPPAAPTPTLTADEQAVKALADQAIQALKKGDMETLAGLIDPAKGVRFSPYAFVNEEDRRYLPNPLKRAFNDPQKYLWGHFDGSGEPIEMTFKQYYERFVYSQDFANAPQVGVNQSFSQGNTINNLADFYPGAIFVEYYFPGFDEQYAGMDWKALRLVFQKLEDQWRLVGIIHDQWTI